MDYFSERERGQQPRVEETVSAKAWGGIVGLIRSLVSTGAFGYKYPEMCPDGHGPVGTDENAFGLALQAEIPDLPWPLETHESFSSGFFREDQPSAPDTLMIMDLVEFCHRAVAKPIQGSYHSFFGHHHLTFDADIGQARFRDDVNRILRRNNLAFQVQDDGHVERIAPPVLRDELGVALFHTGDPQLDQMLEDARTKFLNTEAGVRREGLERLWDCWERIKSLESPQNKKESVAELLNKASAETTFRETLNEEARSLTEIGNNFHIRHSEVTQSAVTDPEHVDYLFHRLFALIQLLLNKRDSG